MISIPSMNKAKSNEEIVTKPYSTGYPTGSYPPKNTTVPYVTNGAASMKAGSLLMAVGLVAALL